MRPLSLALLALAASTAPARCSAAPPDLGRVRSLVFSPSTDRAVALLSAFGSSSHGRPVVAPTSGVAAALDIQPARGFLDEAARATAASFHAVVPHMLRYMSAPHPLAIGDGAADPPSLLAAVACAASFVDRPGELVAYRRRIEDALVAASRVTRRAAHLWRELMPRSVLMAVGDLDVGLYAAVLRAVDWPDMLSLVADLLYGFPIVGFCPVSGCPDFREVSRPASVPSIAAAANAAWNRYLARDVERRFSAGSYTSAAELWRSTIAERDAGMCVGPLGADDVTRTFGGDPDAWRAMRRFAVEQLRSDGSTKVRCCDDACRSGHNEMTSLGETITCERADFPARAAAAFFRAIGDDRAWSMQIGTDDIVAAYRRCGARTPQFSVVCLPDPATGRARFFVLPGLAFGLASAVNQFNRVPAPLVEFLRCRCGVTCSRYFDDYVVCEPDYAQSSGQDILVHLHRLLHLPLAADKHVRMSPSAVFLGILHDFALFAAERVVTMRPKPGRMQAACSRLQQVLDADAISAGEASSIRGKLQFLLSTVIFGGRVFASALRAFRSAATSRRRLRSLGVELRASLNFLIFLLPLLPARHISIRHLARASRRKCVVVWSDAMWEQDALVPGGVGFVVWVPPGHPALPAHRPRGRFLFGARPVSRADVAHLGLLPRQQQVGQLEALAAECVYESLPTIMRNADVLHFVDNTSALYGVVKGSSPQPDSTRIIFSLHLRQLLDRFVVWFSYVASAANVSDLPSRGAIAEMAAALRAVDPTFTIEDGAVAVVFPDISDGWLDRAAERLLPRRHRGRAHSARSRLARQAP